MSDLAKRLRDEERKWLNRYRNMDEDRIPQLFGEAADEIERLERENARLMETAMGLSSARGKL